MQKEVENLTLQEIEALLEERMQLIDFLRDQNLLWKFMEWSDDDV